MTYPISTRSGCWHLLRNLEDGIPEDDEAMTTSERVALSISASILVLRSGFSGPFYAQSVLIMRSRGAAYLLDKVQL